MNFDFKAGGDVAGVMIGGGSKAPPGLDYSADWKSPGSNKHLFGIGLKSSVAPALSFLTTDDTDEHG